MPEKGQQIAHPREERADNLGIQSVREQEDEQNLWLGFFFGYRTEEKRTLHDGRQEKDLFRTDAQIEGRLLARDGRGSLEEEQGGGEEQKDQERVLSIQNA